MTLPSGWAEVRFKTAMPFTTDKIFVDTKVLIYAYDANAGSRQERAAGLLKQLWETRAGRVSTQVLQESYVNVTQKD